MAIFCNSCGQQNDDVSTFCKKCGEPVVATTRRLKTGMLLDNRYKINKLVKSGGMGAVYQALDQRFSSTPCALKEMFSQTNEPEEQEYLISRFKKEAEILHILRHPNLPVVKDYFVHQGRYYLVMDYIEGQDLETIMYSYGGKGVPEVEVIEWAIQILDALSYLHSQNPPIVYRDIKPSNIMIRTSDKRIMLVDFGIARPVATGSITSKTIVGTPAFAPEEIFQGSPEPRSDIYSLGATIHCLLTGKVPSNPFSFTPVRAIKPEVSEEMETILIRSLARRADDRYSSAREMKKAVSILSVNSPLQLDDISRPTLPMEKKKEESFPGPVTSHDPTILPVSYQVNVGKPETPSEKSVPDSGVISGRTDSLTPGKLKPPEVSTKTGSDKSVVKDNKKGTIALRAVICGLLLLFSCIFSFSSALVGDSRVCVGFFSLISVGLFLSFLGLLIKTIYDFRGKN